MPGAAAGEGHPPEDRDVHGQVGAPYISWVVKDGWTICGVQASAVLSNPDVDADLLAEIGYTSGRAKGSTAKGDGKETIAVPIPKKAIDRAEYEQYEGKTFSIAPAGRDGLRQERGKLRAARGRRRRRRGGGVGAAARCWAAAGQAASDEASSASSRSRCRRGSP